MCPAEGYIHATAASYTVVDIEPTGTQITEWESDNDWASDDGYFELRLTFDFPWYGHIENVVHVATNGYLTFGTEHFTGGESRQFPGK